MALYEHVFIARQDLSNAQAEGLIEHFGQVLKDNGGAVVGQEYWGLKTMAYKINKNRKGHYAYVRSDAPAAAVQEMERLMRIHEDVDAGADRQGRRPRGGSLGGAAGPQPARRPATGIVTAAPATVTGIRDRGPRPPRRDDES